MSPASMRQDAYSSRYGPTTGDRVRLGDTDLWLRVEDDHVGYGDEPVWGYARNLRSRMTQHDGAAAASELDVVVAGVLLVDPLLGVIKTSIGIKDGRIAAIGRAGNPDITSGVEVPIGPNTLPVMGYGLIATAGAVDSHVHLITPALVPVALSAGVTTLITAGFEEPPAAMAATLRAFEQLPVNIGLQASARTDHRPPVERVIEAGAIGLKIHEDWGAYPEIIDAVLGLAEEYDVAVALHTDGLNESCELEDTVAAIGGRAVHAYHVEGSGGGHIPDLIGLVREANVICSSTTPTIPYGINAAAEHPEMILAVHGGSGADPADLELAGERVHPATMAAEGPLHELGGIAIVNSDSQGMGRIGETVRRTWQLAHAMKHWRAGPEGQGWPGAPAVRRAGAPPPAPPPPDRRGPATTMTACPPTTTTGCCAISPSTPPSRPSPTGCSVRSARSLQAGSRTSCSGARPTSVSGPSWCSRRGISAGARWARGTPAWRGRSRSATVHTGQVTGSRRRQCR
jgi:urease subunit alpha